MKQKDYPDFIKNKKSINFKSKPKPKILWITGINSSGRQGMILNYLGYDCKVVSTISDLKTAVLGRLKRYSFLKYFIQKKSDDMNKEHIKKNTEKHDKELNDFQPDIVIGSSQGGAIAMEVADRHSNSKYILASPAWKIFNANPSKLPRDTIIMHGTKDITVPLQDSMELVDKYGFELITYEGGHNERPMKLILQCIEKQLRKMKMNSPSSYL